VIHLVTGGAGFIGCHLVTSLIARGHDVIVIDNLSRGQQTHLSASIATGRCRFTQADCAEISGFRAAVARLLDGRRLDVIWHMAANSDIPAGVADPQIDLRDTFMTTFNTLLLMREMDVPEFHFASSSAIYGDWGEQEIREDSAPYRPISNYGAMKLASEAQLCAHLEAHGRRASIFRFPNVVGAPATHGVIFDFIGKLHADPTSLSVLGDGTQQKSYMHVRDLVQAMHFVAEVAPEKVAIYNIGPIDDGVTVRFIAEQVRDTVAPEAAIVYGTGNRGWVGDVPRFRYSVGRLTALGWKPSMHSRDAVRTAVHDIVQAV
jgi:UDP-glucose 4-epimerase